MAPTSHAHSVGPAAGGAALDPNDSAWGSKALDKMDIQPISQNKRNTLRGWNDVPVGVLRGSNKKRGGRKPSRSTATVPMTPAPGFDPNSFTPAPVPVAQPPTQYAPPGSFNPVADGGGGEAQPTPAQPTPAPAPAAAPAPVEALQLSPGAQQMADFLNQCVDICKTSTSAMVASKAQKSAVDLKKKLYEPISNGQVDEGTVENLRALAHYLRGGHHAHVAKEAGGMIRQQELRSIGAGLMALKGLASLVGQFAKTGGWPT